MKWYKKWHTRCQGDARVIKRFLWLPRCIKGECRWLERAKISQMWVGGYDRDHSGWEDEAWVDEG